MSQDLLSLILARLNLNPPILSANELRKHPKQATDALEAAGIIQAANAAASFACADCGALRRVQLEANGTETRGYISCSECGISQVDLDLLRRWAIDVEALVAAVFQTSGAVIAPSKLVPQCLWRVGKANLCGRTRELLFSLCKRRDDDDAALKIIKKRPKSLLFVPTEHDVAPWSSEVGNMVVALDSIASMQGTAVAFDGSYLQGVVSGGDAAALPAKQKTRRRSSRTTKIESLKKVMVEHIRAARDHAVTTRDRTGEAALLQCPTKEEFAKLAGIQPYDVTRCFQDDAGTDLKTLWDLAHDVDRILAYRS